MIRDILLPENGSGCVISYSRSERKTSLTWFSLLVMSSFAHTSTRPSPLVRYFSLLMASYANGSRAFTKGCDTLFET